MYIYNPDSSRKPCRRLQIVENKKWRAMRIAPGHPASLTPPPVGGWSQGGLTRRPREEIHITRKHRAHT